MHRKMRASVYFLLGVGSVYVIASFISPTYLNNPLSDACAPLGGLETAQASPQSYASSTSPANQPPNP
jgi:uncharacterized membrane protein